jgi:hypothetical protein
MDINDLWDDFIIQNPAILDTLHEEIELPVDNLIGNGKGFNIREISYKNSTKWNCQTRAYEIDFSDNPLSFIEANEEIWQMFFELHNKCLELMDQKDLIRVVFFHEQFDKPVSSPFEKKEKFKERNLLDLLFKNVQSAREYLINEVNKLECITTVCKITMRWAET